MTAADRIRQALESCLPPDWREQFEQPELIDAALGLLEGAVVLSREDADEIEMALVTGSMSAREDALARLRAAKGQA